MRIHILYRFHEGPWGGGNQFLSGLRRYLRKEGLYAEDPQDAQVLLFNSYPFGSEELFDIALRLKERDPSRLLILRLDGPISAVRGRHAQIDRMLALFSSLCVDGIVFQSDWSRQRNKKDFEITAPFEEVIHNAPDPEVFKRREGWRVEGDRRIRLIATSWSANWRKGFDIYQYLDEHLDFSRFEMTFVGNSPIEFKRIKHIKPLAPREIAAQLARHDIYLTASIKDPCSNALIEALTVGLPAVARNDGGHPELIGKGGELFDGEGDVLEKIDRVANNYQWYVQRLPNFSMEVTGRRYVDFGRRILKAIQEGKYVPKQVSRGTRLGFMKLKAQILQWKLYQKWFRLWNR